MIAKTRNRWSNDDSGTELPFTEEMLKTLAVQEWRILYGIARRFGNVELADDLQITLGTLRVYVRQVYFKLNMSGKYGCRINRVHLSNWCQRNIGAIEEVVRNLKTDAHVCECRECVERRANKPLRKRRVQLKGRDFLGLGFDVPTMNKISGKAKHDESKLAT